MSIEFAPASGNRSVRSGKGCGSCAVRSQSHRALSGALIFRRAAKTSGPAGAEHAFRCSIMAQVDRSVLGTLFRGTLKRSKAATDRGLACLFRPWSRAPGAVRPHRRYRARRREHDRS